MHYLDRLVQKSCHCCCELGNIQLFWGPDWMPFSLLCGINYVGLLVSSQKGYTFVLSANESQISAIPLCSYHSQDWRPFSIQGKAVNLTKAGCITLVHCEAILGSFMLKEMAKTAASGILKNQTIFLYATFTLSCHGPDRQKRFSRLRKPMCVMRRNSRRGQTL